MATSDPRTAYQAPLLAPRRGRVSRQLFAFCHNFGAIDDFMVELGQLTQFAGKNGNGKSTAQDAIKAIHITRKRKLRLNASKDPHGQAGVGRLTLDDYLLRFEKPKYGPSLLGFHVRLQTRAGKTTRAYTFGFGAKRTTRKYYRAEGELDVQALHEHIRLSSSLDEFGEWLEGAGTAGTFEWVPTIEEYHKWLHDKNLIFYSFDDATGYEDYLTLLRDLTDAIQSGKTITNTRMKELLFPRRQSGPKASQNLNRLSEAFQKMRAFDEETKREERKRAALDTFLDAHKEYYARGYFGEQVAKQEEITGEAASIQEKQRDLENQSRREKEAIKQHEESLAKIEADIRVEGDRKHEYEQAERCCNGFHKYLLGNKEALFTREAALQERLERENNRLAELDQSIEKNKNRINAWKGSITTRKKEIKALQEQKGTAKSEIKGLEQQIEDRRTQLEEIRQDRIGLEQAIRDQEKHREKLGELEDRAASLVRDAALKECELTRDALNTARRKGFNQIEKHNVEIKELAGEEDGGTDLPAFFSAREYKRLVDHFHDVDLETAGKLETVLFPYRNHLVVPREEYERLRKDILAADPAVVEDLTGTNLLITDGPLTPQDLALHSTSMRDTSLGHLVPAAVAGVHHDRRPRHFGDEARRERLAELKQDLGTLEKEQTALTQLDDLVRQVEVQDALLQEQEKKISRICDKVAPEQRLNDLRTREDQLEREKSQIRDEIEKINETLDKFEEKIAEKEQGIKKAEENTSNAWEEIKSWKREKPGVQADIKDLEAKLEGRSALVARASRYQDTARGHLERLGVNHGFPASIREWDQSYDADLKGVLGQLEKFLAKGDERIEGLRDNRRDVQTKLHDQERALEQSTEALTRVAEQLSEKRNEASSLERTLKATLRRELFDVFAFYEADFDPWYAKTRDELAAAPAPAAPAELKEQALRQVEQALRDLEKVFPGIPLVGPSRDGYSLGAVLNSLPSTYAQRGLIAVRDAMERVIKGLKAKMRRTWKDFYVQFKEFFRTIKNRVDEMKARNRAYQHNIEGIGFGTITQLEFNFQTNAHYRQLKRITRELDAGSAGIVPDEFKTALESGQTLQAYFLAQVFGDAAAAVDEALDPRAYFDFDVIDPEEAKSAFSSSTGESAGVAFTVYANALATLREQAHRSGEIFVYIDESGKWDPGSKTKILEIARKLDVRVVISEVDLLREIAPGLVQYRMQAGIPIRFNGVRREGARVVDRVQAATLAGATTGTTTGTTTGAPGEVPDEAREGN